MTEHNDAIKTWDVIYKSMEPEERKIWDENKKEEAKEKLIESKLREAEAKFDLEKHKKLEVLEKNIRKYRTYAWPNKDQNINKKAAKPIKIEATTSFYEPIVSIPIEEELRNFREITSQKEVSGLSPQLYNLYKDRKMWED